LISYFAHPLVLKMEGVPPSETLVNFYGLHGVRSQMILLPLSSAPASSFLAWLTHRPWRQRQYIPPKHR
jgi:hypothetical protein